MDPVEHGSGPHKAVPWSFRTALETRVGQTALVLKPVPFWRRSLAMLIVAACLAVIWIAWRTSLINFDAAMIACAAMCVPWVSVANRERRRRREYMPVPADQWGDAPKIDRAD